MKVAQLIGAMKLVVTEMADPILPSDGLVLKVKACGVCGSDLRRWKEGELRGAKAIIPGHEVAGEVIAVGERVQHDYKVGERLALAPDVHCGKCYYCQRGFFNLCDDLRLVGISPEYAGGFAEKMVLPNDVLVNGIVHRVPDGMRDEAAALAEPCSSVIATHLKCATNASHTVLILGGGPIGCIHISVAKAHGAKVILSEPLQVRRERASTFEPDLLIDPQNEDVSKVVKEFTHGLGVDIAICANPVAATQTLAVEVVRKGGRVILFGGLPKSAPIISLDANCIHYGEISVIGSFSYHPSIHELALQMIQRGLIPAQKLITNVFPLEKIEEAFQAAASGDALKVIVEMNKDL